MRTARSRASHNPAVCVPRSPTLGVLFRDLSSFLRCLVVLAVRHLVLQFLEFLLISSATFGSSRPASAATATATAARMAVTRLTGGSSVPVAAVRDGAVSSGAAAVGDGSLAEPCGSALPRSGIA